MRNLVRALGLRLYEGFQALAAMHFPLPPWPGCPEVPAPMHPAPPGRVTAEERRLIGELSGDLRWPAERPEKEEAP